MIDQWVLYVGLETGLAEVSDSTPLADTILTPGPYQFIGFKLGLACWARLTLGLHRPHTLLHYVVFWRRDGNQDGTAIAAMTRAATELSEHCTISTSASDMVGALVVSFLVGYGSCWIERIDGTEPFVMGTSCNSHSVKAFFRVIVDR
jgi:hypothetical protein